MNPAVVIAAPVALAIVREVPSVFAGMNRLKVERWRHLLSVPSLSGPAVEIDIVRLVELLWQVENGGEPVVGNTVARFVTSIVQAQTPSNLTHPEPLPSAVSIVATYVDTLAARLPEKSIFVAPSLWRNVELGRMLLRALDDKQFVNITLEEALDMSSMIDGMAYWADAFTIRRIIENGDKVALGAPVLAHGQAASLATGLAMAIAQYTAQQTGASKIWADIGGFGRALTVQSVERAIWQVLSAGRMPTLGSANLPLVAPLPAGLLGVRSDLSEQVMQARARGETSRLEELYSQLVIASAQRLGWNAWASSNWHVQLVLDPPATWFGKQTGFVDILDDSSGPVVMFAAAPLSTALAEACGQRGRALSPLPLHTLAASLLHRFARPVMRPMTVNVAAQTSTSTPTPVPAPTVAPVVKTTPLPLTAAVSEEKPVVIPTLVKPVEVIARPATPIIPTAPVAAVVNPVVNPVVSVVAEASPTRPNTSTHTSTHTNGNVTTTGGTRKYKPPVVDPEIIILPTWPKGGEVLIYADGVLLDDAYVQLEPKKNAAGQLLEVRIKVSHPAVRRGAMLAVAWEPEEGHV